jgi:Uma2 family endonuclease
MEGQDAALHDAVVYPVRDDTPMGETDRHRDELIDSVSALKHHFRGQPDVYVSGNNFVYYVQGDPSAVVSPDTYVVRGVSPEQRDTFKVWEEGGKRPCFALEITSRKSRQTDLGRKKSCYQDDLGVQEYFLYDPRGEWLPEQLRGYALEGDEYRRIEPGPNGRLPSRQLGLELGLLDGHLRYWLPGAERPLPVPAELAQRADEERQRADEERQRADELAREVARLRAQLAGRGESPGGAAG